MYFQMSKSEKCYNLIFSLALSPAKDLSYNQKKVASSVQLASHLQQHNVYILPWAGSPIFSLPAVEGAGG